MKLVFPCILSITLLVSSCVETIVMDSHEELPVAVYCVLEESDTQTLELYFAKGKSYTEYSPITEAEVSLYCFDEKVADFIHYYGAVWKASYKPECSRLYQLQIQIPQRDLISAKTKMPDNFDVFCFWEHKEGIMDLSGYAFTYELRVLHRSPSHPDTYGTPFNNKSNLWVFPLSQWTEGKPNQEEYQYNELIATDHPYADLFNVSGLLLKELPCFQEESYSQFNQFYRDDLLWMPERFPDLPMCKNFVHINHPAHFDNGQDITAPDCTHYSTGSFVLSTNFITEYEVRDNPDNPLAPITPLFPGDNYYEFISVSDELDLYLRDLYIKDLNRDNMSLLYSTENIHSNIDNGTGVFGAKITRYNFDSCMGYRDED
jgi:hypothetical protein